MVPVSYHPNFIDKPDECLERFWNELSWVQHEFVPRREYYCPNKVVPYTYGSGRGVRTYSPQSQHELIVSIRHKIEDFTKTTFDVCFLNGYADQSDHLGWHSDNSPEMDDERPIAIISLGVEREIWFRAIPLNDGKCVACNGSGIYDDTGSPPCGACNGTGRADPPAIEKLLLGNGSLCLMAPGMQDTHQHRIPKAGFKCGRRISLTYRGFSVGF